MFAVLHIADFALHAVLRTEHIDAVRRPAALFSGIGKKSLVLAVNPPARAQGVETGMTAPQAMARCPRLLIREPSTAAESEARATLHAVGFTLSPAIEDTAPGICTCDLAGYGPAPEPPAKIAVRELGELGLPATAGIARTPLLALYAARSAGRSTGVRRVDDEVGFLAPLPLAVADPSPELAEVLGNWGLRTLGHLTTLPRDEIVRRFGAEGLALWQRAAGGATRPLRRIVPARDFFGEMQFEHTVETLEPLLFILRRILDRLTLELRASQHVAAELILSLRLEDDTPHARHFRLPEPTADAEVLFRTLHTHLESLQTAAAIAAVSLAIAPTRPLVRQQGLFETGLRDPHGFAETLARLGALVGTERVGTPRLLDTHRADAVELITPAPVIPPPSEPPLHPPLGLPLRRFRPPLPVRLEFTSGRPTYLWTERVQGEIVAQSEAWTASGDWWQRDRAWQRTEWDIALATGGLYRLIRSGEAYSLEGEYD